MRKVLKGMRFTLRLKKCTLNVSDQGCIVSKLARLGTHEVTIPRASVVSWVSSGLESPLVRMFTACQRILTHSWVYRWLLGSYAQQLGLTAALMCTESQEMGLSWCSQIQEAVLLSTGQWGFRIKCWCVKCWFWATHLTGARVLLQGEVGACLQCHQLVFLQVSLPTLTQQKTSKYCESSPIAFLTFRVGACMYSQQYSQSLSYWW